jgi:hypothetical protein
MLLAHTSGEAADVSLKDPWGLDGADKSEGIHRALTTPLQSPVVADGVEAVGDELSVDIDQPAAQLGEDKRPVG